MKAYVSYDINCEEIYDEDGEVSYGDDYWLISNVFVDRLVAIKKLSIK